MIAKHNAPAINVASVRILWNRTEREWTACLTLLN